MTSFDKMRKICNVIQVDAMFSEIVSYKRCCLFPSRSGSKRPCPCAFLFPFLLPSSLLPRPYILFPFLLYSSLLSCSYILIPFLLPSSLLSHPYVRVLVSTDSELSPLGRQYSRALSAFIQQATTTKKTITRYGWQGGVLSTARVVFFSGHTTSCLARL